MRKEKKIEGVALKFCSSWHRTWGRKRAGKRKKKQMFVGDKPP